MDLFWHGLNFRARTSTDYIECGSPEETIDPGPDSWPQSPLLLDGARCRAVHFFRGINYR